MLQNNARSLALNNPPRSLTDVRAEMLARIELVGERQAALVLTRGQIGLIGVAEDEAFRGAARELALDAAMLGRWIAVIDAELARREG